MEGGGDPTSGRWSVEGRSPRLNQGLQRIGGKSGSVSEGGRGRPGSGHPLSLPAWWPSCLPFILRYKAISSRPPVWESGRGSAPG